MLLLVASSSLVVILGGVASWLAPSKAYAACANNNFPQEKQHGNSAKMCPGFNDIAGEYEVTTELKIQSAHITDRQHPYASPAPNWEHHHSSAPDPFIYTQFFNILSEGNESALLAGFPNKATGNPYDAIYKLRFRADDNAKFVNIVEGLWSGELKIPQGTSGGLTGFGFNITGPGGAGGGLSLNWDNGTAPTGVSMLWTGDTDNPEFSFTYVSPFTFDNNSSLQVRGFIMVRNSEDEFGRVYTNGWASVLEDVGENQKLIGFLQSSVYDVVHVPGQVPLLGIGVAFRYSRKMRKLIKSSRSGGGMNLNPLHCQGSARITDV